MCELFTMTARLSSRILPLLHLTRLSTIARRNGGRNLSSSCVRLQQSESDDPIPIRTSHDVTEAMRRQPLVDDDQPHFPGTWRSSYTDTMQFIKPELKEVIPTYRVLNWEGVIVNESEEPKLSKETILEMYKTMKKLHTMDDILMSAQRQGRIPFYMAADGEEGIHIGSAAALDPDDEIYAQYREQGVLMWRGYTLNQFINQCIGNVHAHGRARQMPLHYGSKKLHYVTISSPLSTEMPQAVGYAYGMKRAGSKNCVVCYFGDGASSEGDAHAAFNLAATLEVPVVYICRNNGFAISTRSYEQYHGDGIAARGQGYGMCSIRVDGNDVFAVYNATKEARVIAMAENRPVLIECMTYRVGHHGTSDDSLRYRTKEEVDYWKRHNPIDRCRKYLIGKGWWDDQDEKRWQEEVTKMILDAIQEGETQMKPSPYEMFTDVYKEMPPSLKKQADYLMKHLKEYHDEYPNLDNFDVEKQTPDED